MFQMDASNKLTKYQDAAIKRGGRLLSTTIAKRKLQWQCNEGHIFWLTGHKVHRKGKWCEVCGSSIGERNIRAILKEFNIPFTQQYQIQMIPTRMYDFYFEYQGRKFLIEFDGEQHFSFVRKYHKTKAKFNESQVIDRVKTYAAWNSNITIIRIDYTQINNIKHHIISAVNSPNIVYLSDPNLYKYISDVNITSDQFQQYLQACD